MTAPALPGPGLWTVLTPKWRGALVRIKHERTASRAKFFLLSTIGICFWTAVFGIAFRVLRYIRHVEDIGNLLAAKVLGIILVSFLSILVSQQHHHGAVDVFPREGPRFSGGGPDRLAAVLSRQAR